MCLVNTPKQQAYQLPAEPAATKSPNAAAVSAATGTRVSDQLTSQTQTILTSPKGVLEEAPTSKKTLLGQ